MIVHMSRHCLRRLSARFSVQRALVSTSCALQSTTFERDILHRSIVSTDHFQSSLPRLPIPKLEDTCMRYLKSQEALLSPADHEKTLKIVNNFLQGDGPKLHSALVARDKKNKHTSYISGPWFDMYLKYRDPIVLNHNPFIGLQDDPKKEYNDPVLRSANVIVSSLRFMKSLRANILKPEVFHLDPAKTDNPDFWKKIRIVPKFASFYASALMYKVFPLDISQYWRLFNTTRIPRRERDELYTDEKAKNIVVLRRGHLYSFDVLDKDGNIVNEREILAHLRYIEQLDHSPAEHPLAIMTSEHRDTWADTRDKLIQAGNEELLKTVDGALFVLALDDKEPVDEINYSRSFLYGDGSNRWFDKSFELIVTPGGKMCVNMEHAWGDGVAVLRYINEVYADSTQHPRLNPDSVPASVDSSAAVSRLDFKLTDEIKQQMKKSLQKFKDTTGTLGFDFIQYQRQGKKFLKKQKLSPDSFMQLAFQMGFQRQYGETAATYESCSTAAFRHGRTETIRPATSATKATCDAFLRSGGDTASLAELRAVMEECSKMHGQLTKEAAMGKGFDRHLFGLKHIAAEQGGELPEMFRDPAYARINHIILSTSTLSSPAVQLGGFAAVTPDGYGIGYSTFDDWLGMNVTCYPSRDVKGFIECVRQSFDDMIDVLEGKDFRK